MRLRSILAYLYKDDRNIRVFWRGREDRDFKMSELLFGLAVCQLKKTRSVLHARPLCFVDRCLWLVESELDRNSRNVVVDFSKLVMGSSRMKLFVAGLPLSPRLPREEREQPVLEMCKGIAASCDGQLFLCFIPHPKEWSSAGCGPSIWKWAKTDWRPL